MTYYHVTLIFLYYSINYIITIMCLVYFVTFLFALHRPLFSETGATLLAPEANRIAHELSQCSSPCWDGYKTSWLQWSNDSTFDRSNEVSTIPYLLSSYSLFLVGWMYIMGYIYIYLHQIIIEITFTTIYIETRQYSKKRFAPKLQG